MIVKQGNMTFDGIDAKDHGILISGEGTFDAPARVYEMVEVPGRNGAVAIDQGRYENIEISYPAGVWGEDPQTFREKLAAYRSELGARIGYKRLEDTYHPDEFRMGIFSDAIEVEPSGYNTAGKFEVVFNCKPQRFLKSGEAQINLSGAARHNVNGNPISFEWTSSATLHSLILELCTRWTGPGAWPTWANPTPTGEAPTPYNPGVVEPWDEAEIFLNGASEGIIDVSGDIGADIPNATINLQTGAYTVSDWMYSFDGTEDITQDAYGNYSWAIPSVAATVNQCTRFYKRIYFPGVTVFNDGDCWEQNGRFYWKMSSVNLTRMKELLAEWDAAGQPMTIICPRATAMTGYLTAPALSYVANQINTLQTDRFGYFRMDITAARTLDNPTPFRAYPIVEITGTGTVTIGDTTLTISSNANPPIYLDCELMEAYSLVGGVITSANSLITMSNHIFPSLPPGASVIQASSGITGLKVTPRWWRL